MELNTNNTINLSYLDATFGGNKDIIKKVIQSFLDNTPQLIIELTDNATKNNWEEVKLIAHKMKSSYHTIGAKKAGDILARVELESSDGNQTTIYLLINQVKGLSNQVFKEIEMELK